MDLSAKAVLVTTKNSTFAPIGKAPVKNPPPPMTTTGKTSIPVLPLQSHELVYDSGGMDFLMSPNLSGVDTYGISLGDSVLFPFDLEAGGTQLIFWGDVPGPVTLLCLFWDTDENAVSVPLTLEGERQLHVIDVSVVAPPVAGSIGYIQVSPPYPDIVLQYVAFSLMGVSAQHLPYSVLPIHWK